MNEAVALGIAEVGADHNRNMIRVVYLVLTGIAGGILAGLGMGGGTLTIPLLVLALNVGQLTAQSANLFAFLPTGTLALFVHTKNGYIVLKDVAFLILPALLMATVASFFATMTSGEVLQKIYGGFLIAVAMVSLVAKIIQIRKIGYLH